MDRNAGEKDIQQPEIFHKNFIELCGLIAKCDDEKFIFDFLECLFTKNEREDIGKRWLLVKSLDEGKTQREIAKEFGMSLCRITRGSKELKKEGSAFRKMIDASKM